MQIADNARKEREDLEIKIANAVLLPIAMTMKAEVKRKRRAVLHGGVLILDYPRHDGADTRRDLLE